MRKYDKLFKPLGYKVFPRNMFYKDNPYLDLYYDRLGLDWFGEFKVSRKTYITSFGAKTKSPEELIKLIEEYNKTRICPSYCYSPTLTGWANLQSAFTWYLESLGFYKDTSFYNHGTFMIMTNIYGEEISRIYIDLPKDDSYNGSIIRYFNKGFSWIESPFDSVDSMTSREKSFETKIAEITTHIILENSFFFLLEINLFPFAIYFTSLFRAILVAAPHIPSAVNFFLV